MPAYSFQQQIKKLIAGPVFVKRVQQVSGCSIYFVDKGHIMWYVVHGTCLLDYILCDCLYHSNTMDIHCLHDKKCYYIILCSGITS